ncbi:MAG: hypothetical protein KC418_05445 [Anaerolineales bacterium]|nr:hypothetical protein [Anaerolineales bacterium]MCB8951255.1 hypothetical protein [Ardenticatenales bacterium]
MPAPLLLILGPLLPALLTAIIRRWPRVAAAVGSASALLLWRFIAVVPLAPHQPPTLGLFAGDTLTLLGRSLVLTEGVRLAFALLFAGLAVLLLLAVWLPQGSDFIPASLTVLALLSAAIMARPFSFGVLLLLAAAAVSTAVIQANLPSSSDAALRYLVFVALATPLFLVAGWMLDSGQLSLQSAVWRLLLVGFAMLLAGFPFYVWVRPIVLTASSLTPAFQFGLMQFAQFMMVLALLRENNWVADVPSFLSLLRWSGLLTLVLGGALALTSRNAGSVLGSLLLLDMGAVLMLLTMGSDGAGVALTALLTRFGALISAGVGITVLHRSRQQENHTLSWWLGLAAFLYGALSLAGFPLTPGFAPRWGLVTLLAREAGGWRWVGLVLLSVAAGVGGLVKCGRSLAEMPADPLQLTRSWREVVSWPAILALVLLLLSGVALALFPHIITRQAAELVTLLARSGN